MEEKGKEIHKTMVNNMLEDYVARSIEEDNALYLDEDSDV